MQQHERKPAAARASHDTVNPPALLELMMRDWRRPKAALPPKIRGAERFKARRRALSHTFPDEVLVIPTGHEKVRANDTTYRFRPGSDFYYLTGNLEPDGVLVLAPRRGGHDDILFVEPNPGRKDATFFTDRMKGELWVGPRLGVDESRHRYQVDRALPLADLGATVRKLARRHRRVRVLRGIAADVDGFAHTHKDRDQELGAFLSEARLIKDNLEVAALTRACAASRRGFEDIIRALKHAKSEREVEGIFNLRARVEGNDVGYNTIAAAGAHACILHWTHNHGALKRGDLILVDAGVEGHEIYTADVTRTLPLNGKFSREQRVVYDLVRAAQQAGFRAVKPGNDFLEPNRAAMRVLARGLYDLGILRVPVDEALRDDRQLYKRYTLHNVSHMLGLDVHDCAQARAQTYKYGALKPGMVLTVEPGLYFQVDDLTVPERFRGIGVRIEDDVLVTRRGCRILSNLPRDADDVERWMRALWRTR